MARWTSGMEPINDAWHRRYWYRQSAGWNGKGAKNAFRFRGYTELVMCNIPSDIRNKMVTILQRGYSMTVAEKVMTPLNFVLNAYPGRKFPIGFLGKNKMMVHAMPDRVCELADAIRGHVIMSERFPSKAVRVQELDDAHGFSAVYVNLSRSLGRNEEQGAQLRPMFNNMRPVIDSFMEEWLDVRMPVIRFVLEDESLVQVPFFEDPK